MIQSKDMRRPETIQWDLPISASDFEILKKGCKPRSMDDRWSVRPTYLRESHAYSISWTRSWTGDPHYTLIIVRNLSSRKGPVIESMIYESFTQSDIDITAEMAKQEVICLSRNMLGCEIKAFPEIDEDQVFSYPLDPAD
ncbi:uncharacterized protein K489DRAFT_376111 [Dissoconium aciculare CBS 342.82]|uniref:Uncharacterized protein n=1 Tax=Dissoconium aciculare CBS 342.82 TaxID=1314786 RepID=A0A6J3MLT8_9PEZI|nr:uncharacterized protein K489DRAFT_376111 [Dissoconium aciculare CBS 342.82]KAF1827952.1 hypothetical protein K489DRAFT_376111 [Dissoconium aciculare CBS 342.82]